MAHPDGAKSEDGPTHNGLAMPSPFYRSRAPRQSGPAFDATPLQEAYKQEAQADGATRELAIQQDVIAQQQRQDAQFAREQAAAGRAAAKATAQAHEISVKVAKSQGVETVVDPMTGKDAIKTTPDGAPVWRPGFQGGIRPGDNGRHVVDYRDTTGATYRLPVDSIRRNDGPTGPVYEFDVPGKDGKPTTIRRAEEPGKPLFKIDPETGMRYAEAQDQTTGGLIQQPIGMDPQAANKAAIKNIGAEWDRQKAERTFKADELRLQQQVIETENAPAREKLAETERKLKTFDTTGAHYIQEPDGTILQKRSASDTGMPVNDNPQELLKAQSWLAEKKRLEGDLARLTAEQEPVTKKLQEMQVQRDKMALSILQDGHKTKLRQLAMEKAAAKGAELWKPATQQRIEQLIESPGFSLLQLEAENEGQPMAEDIARATRNPALESISNALGGDGAPLPDANQIGNDLDGSALGDTRQRVQLDSILATAPKTAKLPDGKPDVMASSKSLGIDKPAEFDLEGDGQGLPRIVHRPSGRRMGLVDAKNNRLIIDPDAAYHTEEGRAMVKAAGNDTVPLFVLAGGVPFTPRERADYFANAVAAAQANDSEGMASVGADLAGIRRNVQEGRLSVQDAKWLSKTIHGYDQPDLSDDAVNAQFSRYIQGSKVESAMWTGDKATPESRAEVVNRFMDGLSQKSRTAIFYNAPRLDELRERLMGENASKGMGAKVGDWLADTAKMLLGSISGLAANLTLDAGEIAVVAGSLGGYKTSERFNLTTENTAEWLAQASKFASRVAAQPAMQSALTEVRNWAGSADPEDTPPPELMDKLAGVAFDSFHQLSDDAEAKARATTKETFDLTKDPVLAKHFSRYLETRNPAHWEAIKQLMGMDNASRALADRTREYITRPRAATPQDVMDRAASVFPGIRPEQAKALLDAASSKDGGTKAAKILGVSPEDGALALDLFTGKAATSETSLNGYFRAGMQAPLQEVALEAASTALSAGFGKIAARGFVQAAKGVTVQASRRAAAASWVATQAATLVDDFTRLGMFRAKLGQPLTRLQKASNAAVTAVKAVSGDMVGEAAEEGAMEVGQAGSTLGSVFAAAGQGAIAAPLMVGGMTVLALPVEIRNERRMARDWEAAKSAYLATINERLAEIPGTQPLAPEEFETALALYGNAAARLDAENLARAAAVLESGPPSPQAQEGLMQAVVQAKAREALAVNAALEMRDLTEEQRTLYTAVAKAAMGVPEFTLAESQALNRLGGDLAVRFTAAPGATQVDAYSATDLPGGRQAMAQGAVPVVPPALMAQVAQTAPSLGELMGMAPTPQVSPVSNGATPTTPTPAATGPKTTSGDSGNAPATPAKGGVGKAQGVPKATPADGAPVPTFQTAPKAEVNVLTNGRVTVTFQGDPRRVAGEAKAKGFKVVGQQTTTGKGAQKRITLTLQPKEATKPSGQQGPTAEKPETVDSIARRVISTITSRSPKLKKLVSESKAAPDYATGGMWLNSNGTVSYHLPTLRQQLTGLDPQQIGRRIEALIDEEIRHAAHWKAAERLYNQAMATPGNLQVDFETWRDAWYGNIWENEFTDAMRSRVREAYGDTMDAMPDWMKAMEGLRMLDQLRATGSITEAVLKHLEAVLAVLKEMLDQATPAVRREIEAIQAVLVEFGYENGQVKPDAAKKPAKPKSKPKAESPAGQTVSQPGQAVSQTAPQQDPLPESEIAKLRNALRQLRRWKQDDAYGAGYEQAINNYERGTWTLQDTPRPADTLEEVERETTKARQFWIVQNMQFIEAENNKLANALAQDPKVSAVVGNPGNDAQNLRIYLADEIKNVLVKGIRQKLAEDPRFGMFYDFISQDRLKVASNGTVYDDGSRAYLDMMAAKVKERIGSSAAGDGMSQSSAKASQPEAKPAAVAEAAQEAATSPAAEAQAGPATSKPPEQMTPEEWAEASKERQEKKLLTRIADLEQIIKVSSPDAVQSEVRQLEKARESLKQNRKWSVEQLTGSHPLKVEEATKSNQPVSAAAVDAYGITLPEGYVRQGDLYVYRPTPEPAPASQEQASPPPASQETASQPEAKPAEPSREEWQKTFAKFKRALAKAVKAKDYPEIIRQADAFQKHYEAEGSGKFPDSWSDWERHKAEAEMQLARQGKTENPLTVPILKPLTTPRPAERTDDAYTKAQEATRAALGGLFSAPAYRTIPQLEVSSERFDAVRKAAVAILEANIRTPEAFARFMDDTFPGGKARPYSEAIWDMIGVADKSLRGTHDWTAIYGKIDEPLPDVQEPAIDETPEMPQNGGDEAPADIREPDQPGIRPVGDVADTAEQAGEPGGAGRDNQRPEIQPENLQPPGEGGNPGKMGVPDVRPDSGNLPKKQKPKGGQEPGGDGPAAGDGGEGSGVAGSERTPQHSPGRDNYQLTDPESIVGGGPKARFHKNKAALELLDILETENREPTPAELDTLAAYTGWGALGQELFQGSFENYAGTPEWRDEAMWLRDRLGKEDWTSAQDSILNAHYTDPPTVTAMWDMIRRMGFTGGRVLEPSEGIGNVWSLMPRDLMAKSQLTGIEMDPTTSAIAKMLHPKVNHRTMPYQKSTTSDNFYDVALGNWPFSNNDKPADRRWDHLEATVHNFFFIKALAQVRPGGLVVGITSAGTMDSKSSRIRKYLAARGELVASFRLPTGAFGKYAGTKVVTDLIILRKREKELDSDAGDQGWINSVKHPDFDFHINEYYLKNPSHILGKLGFGHGTTYGRAGMIVDRNADYDQVLAKLAERLPEGVFAPWNGNDMRDRIINNTTKESRQNTVVEQSGELYTVNGESLTPLDASARWKTKTQKTNDKRMAEAKAIIAIRDAFTALMRSYQAQQDSSAPRAALKSAYEAFRAAHGNLSDSFMLDKFEKAGDPYALDIRALVEVRDGTESPRAIMDRDIMRLPKLETKGNIADAYAAQRANSPEFDAGEVAKMAGVTEQEVIEFLSSSGTVFKTPQGFWEPGEIYLSGNVRRKLREAEAAKAEGVEGMDANIAALRAIVPADVPYYAITTQMGVSWIPLSDYTQFIQEKLNGRPEDIHVSKVSGGYNVRISGRTSDSTEARNTYNVVDERGEDHLAPSRIFQAAMNGTALEVKVETRNANNDKIFVVDEALTRRAMALRDRIRNEFARWVWEDESRAARLSYEYNEAMNSVVNAKFDGGHLTMPGLALSLGKGSFDLRKHQLDAIWRGIVNRKGVYAHEVGTGKTFTMAGIAIEGKRQGRHRKPLLFAHNANSAAVAADFRRAYPGARILYLDSLSPSERDLRLRQIAADDWDAVIVPHSLIDRFGLKADTLFELARAELDALESEFWEAAGEIGISRGSLDLNDSKMVFGAINNARGADKNLKRTAKELASARRRIVTRIEKQISQFSRPGTVFFEDMGIDAIMVDEAHVFKKISLATRKQIKGLNKSESGKGFQLGLLTDYLKRENNGNGVHLFTGTPVTNTLNEVFNMMRYVMHKEMSEQSIENFDDWYNSYARGVTDIEPTSGGTWEAVERLRAFLNIPELARLAGQVFDVVRAKDMPEFLPRPSNDGFIPEGQEPEGRPSKVVRPVVIEPPPIQKRVMSWIRQRFAVYRDLPNRIRGMLKKMGGDAPNLMDIDGKNAALDPRLVDPSAEDDPNSKVNTAISRLLEHYGEHPNATQMVFLERGANDFTTAEVTVYGPEGPIYDNDGNKQTRKETRKQFNILRDMVEKLVAQGVKPEEIAVFHNLNLLPLPDGREDVLKKVRRVSAATPKDEIAAMMNRGEVRIAFGGTETMGTGVNAQTWLRAMHHLDVPWMPGELEQRNGRGHRQGNRWNTVFEYRYTMEGTHDGKMWSTLLNKVRFIERFTEMLQGRGLERTLEGDGADASEADDEAGASDFEQMFSKAAGDPRILLRVKMERDLEKLRNDKQIHYGFIEQARRKAEQLENYIPRQEDGASKLDEDFNLFKSNTTGGFSAKLRDKTYTERAEFDEAMKRLPMFRDRTKVGEFAGFDIQAVTSIGANLFELTKPGTHYGYQFTGNSAASMEGVLRFLGKRASNIRADIEKSRADIAKLRAKMSEPFPGEKALNDQEQAYAVLVREIVASPTPAPGWLRYGAPAGSLIYLRENGKLIPKDVLAHRWDNNGYWILVDNKGEMTPVRYTDAFTDEGRAMFEEHEFTEPPQITVNQDSEAGGQSYPGVEESLMSEFGGRLVIDNGEVLRVPRWNIPPPTVPDGHYDRAGAGANTSPVRNDPNRLLDVPQVRRGLFRRRDKVRSLIEKVEARIDNLEDDPPPTGADYRNGILSDRLKNLEKELGVIESLLMQSNSRGDEMLLSSAPAPSMPRDRAEAIVRNLGKVEAKRPLNPRESRDLESAKAVLASAPAPDQNKQAVLKQALDAMPPIWRTVLEASMKGTPAEQIAQDNGLSVVAVGNVLRVASGRLDVLMRAQAGKLKPSVRVENDKIKAASGRPDLAMSANPSFVAVDQRRESPEEVTHAEMNELAARMFDLEPDAAERLVVRWMDSGTTVLSTDGFPDTIRIFVQEAQARSAAEMLMTAAAKQLVTKRALSGGDPIQTARLIDLYRNTGTEQARALNMRQDEHMTPEERSAMFISEALLTPPEPMRNEIRRNPANKDKILARWAVESQKVKEALKAEGYDIDATFAALRRERAAAERTIPQEVRLPLARAKGRTQRLVKAVLEGKTWREAAEAAKMSLEQARAAYNDFRQAINQTGQQAAQAARDALLRSAPVNDFAAQIGLPEWTEDASPDASPVQTQATEELKKERTRKKKAGEFDLSNPVAVARATQVIGSHKSTAFDKISEFWRASILSGPQTHIVNIASGLSFGAYEMTIKKAGQAVAADIARMFGMKPSAASLADVPAVLSATIPAVKAGLKDALKAWRANESFFSHYATATEKKSGAWAPAIKGKFGTVVRTPFRAMLLADEFVKSTFTRIEAAAQARQIARDEGKSGADMANRIAELMTPGSLAWARALDKALEITFQTELKVNNRVIDSIDGLADLIQSAKRGKAGWLIKGISHFLFPFVLTPTNIFKAGVTMSPLGLGLSIADAIRAYNMKKSGNVEEANRLYNAGRFLDDMVNQIVAWGVGMIAWELVMPGEDDDALPFLTGTLPWKSTSKGEREIAYRTAPPMSIRIGDTWYSYARLDPFASALSFTVDAVKAMKEDVPMDEAWMEIGSSMLTAMQDKTFLQGFSDFLNAIDDPKRFGTRWATNIATGFIPNLIRQPIRAADENIRENDLPNDMGFVEGLATRVLHSAVPQTAVPAIDVWGRPETKGTGSGSPQTDFLLRLFSPVQPRGTSSVDPLDVALLRYNYKADKPFGVTAPTRELVREMGGKQQKASLSDADWEAFMAKSGRAARLAIGSRFNGRDLTENDVETIKDIISRAQSSFRDIEKRKAFARPPVTGAQP